MFVIASILAPRSATSNKQQKSIWTLHAPSCIKFFHVSPSRCIATGYILSTLYIVTRFFSRMSSDSEELTPAPRDESRDALIAGALRKAVADTFKKNRDDVTLRYIRTLVEDQLTLGAQFFKSDDYWKNQSKDIVLQEVVRFVVVDQAKRERCADGASMQDIQTANAEAPASPEKKKPARKPARKPAAKKAKEPTLDNDGDEEPKSPKRARAAKSTEKKSAPKRARAKSKATVEDKSEAGEASKPVPEPAANNESGLEDEPPKKKRAKKNEAKQSASPKASPKKAGKVGATETVKKDTTPAIAVGSTPGDESEMSEVLDTPPPSPKKRNRGRSSTGETKKGGAPSKSKKEKPAVCLPFA